MGKKQHPSAVEGDEKLVDRVKRTPSLSAPDETRERVEDWLKEIGKSAPGRTLKSWMSDLDAVRALIECVAEGSPYLWDLIRSDPSRLVRIFDAPPQARLAAALAETAAAIQAATDDEEAMRLLRALKSEAALLIALSDIGGLWPVTTVTRALTEVADASVRGAVRFLFNGAVREGKLRPADAAHPEAGSGYFVLAMGKMGAFELNYSSDIDLIVFFDSAVLSLAEGIEPTQFFVRMTRRLVKLLQERTGDGYVFRTDLRLRPDPAATQIAMSTAAALSYYESIGQNWERAALIKARVCAGDGPAGEAFLRDVSPFIWRKYLDYAAIADVHAMKRQIHAYKGHDQIAVEGHNVKLGRGGIREIEFFAQTQQLIAGGRNADLRGRQTLPTLEMLAQEGWIGSDARKDLQEAYCFLRTVEHRLQMVADEQTQTLPSDTDELARFARFLGYPGRDQFAEAFLGHLRKVQAHYGRLFEDESALSAARHALAFPNDKDDRETLDKLVEMGFARPIEASATVRRWLSGSYRSLRGELARAHLSELVPLLIDHLARAENPDNALGALDRFLAGLHGGARLLSLLRQNPDLVSLLSLVLGTAPRLADIVAHHPQVMDALLDPAFFGVLPDESKLAAGLNSSLGASASYEDFLDRVRIFGQEQMFLIGARILSGTVSAEQAGDTFARLADVLIRALHGAVEENFVRSHGRLRGQHSAILAMGKLGGREMTASSDLDLIVVYDFDGEHPESDGPRPLYGAQYFARLTQRVISSLTTRTNYGALYDVDMRLRPSGRSGPVATRIEGFRDYQEQEAWTWEHMALTRARVVSGSAEFAGRVHAVLRDVLCRPRDRDAVAGDVVEMRRAIAEDKGDDERWNLKHVAGGLIDLEFIAQFIQLVHAAEHPEVLDTSTARVFDRAWRLGILSAEEAEIVRQATRLYHNLTQILRLCLPGTFDPKTAGNELPGLLARAADVPDFATLEAHLVETQAAVRNCFIRILGSPP